MVPDAIIEADDTEPLESPPLLDTQEPEVTDARGGVDLWMLGAILGLLAVGTIQIYSASAVYAEGRFGSSTHFLTRQLSWLVLGFGAMALAARTDYDWLRRTCYPMLLGAFVLLVAVLFLGTRVNSARRWFSLGAFSLQPVELAKVALVAYLATSLARKQDKVKTFTVGFLPHLAVCGLMMALLLKQPDLGSALILGATTLLLLFIAGTKISYIVLALLAATPVVYWAVVGTPWRLRRLLAFLDPWQFREGVGYQITESLISIGSGGAFGIGLGQGMQKLYYLPEAHTDFIMSSIGEELGFAGLATVVLLFVLLLWRGVRSALRARDAFGMYLAFGLTSIFALQALVNTGVVLGALPAKGLTLPFVSYGGSSLVVSMFCAGILLNISRRSPAPARAGGPRLENSVPANRRKRRRVRVRVK